MEEYLQAKRERERTGFDINTFTLFWVLKQSGASDSDKVAPKVVEKAAAWIGHFAVDRSRPMIRRSLELRLRKLEQRVLPTEQPRKRALHEFMAEALAAQGWQFDEEGRPLFPGPPSAPE